MNDEPISECTMPKGKVSSPSKNNQVVVHSLDKLFEEKYLKKKILSQQSPTQRNIHVLNVQKRV